MFFSYRWGTITASGLELLLSHLWSVSKGFPAIPSQLLEDRNIYIEFPILFYFFLFFSSEKLKGFQVFSYYIYGKNYLYMHRQSVQGKKMKNPILLQWMITPSASNYTDKNPPPPPSQCFLYLVCKTYTCVHLYAHQNRSELKQFLFMWPRPGRDDAYF